MVSRFFHRSFTLLVTAFAAGTLILTFSASLFRKLESMGEVAVAITFYTALASTLLLPGWLAFVMFHNRPVLTDHRDWALDWSFVIIWTVGFWLFVLYAISSYTVV
jgi:hypothetical protein